MLTFYNWGLDASCTNSSDYMTKTKNLNIDKHSPNDNCPRFINMPFKDGTTSEMGHSAVYNYDIDGTIQQYMKPGKSSFFEMLTVTTDAMQKYFAFYDAYNANLVNINGYKGYAPYPADKSSAYLRARSQSFIAPIQYGIPHTKDIYEGKLLEAYDWNEDFTKWEASGILGIRDNKFAGIFLDNVCIKCKWSITTLEITNEDNSMNADCCDPSKICEAAIYKISIKNENTEQYIVPGEINMEVSLSPSEGVWYTRPNGHLSNSPTDDDDVGYLCIQKSTETGELSTDIVMLIDLHNPPESANFYCPMWNIITMY